MNPLKPAIVRMTASPRLLADGSVATLRMAGGGNRVGYYFNSNHYRAGVFDLPRFGANFGWDENGWNGAARPQFAAIRWSPSVRADLANYASLYLWKDAPITADIGDEEDTVVTIENRLWYSKRQDQWASPGNVTANTTTAPDGSLTADRIVGVNGLSNSEFTSGNFASPFTLSVFARYIDHPYFMLTYFGTTIGGIFDIQNGRCITSFGATAIYIVPYPNGWFRCVVVAPWPGGSYVGVSLTDKVGNFAAIGKFAAVWQAQMIDGYWNDGGPIVETPAGANVLRDIVLEGGTAPSSWTAILAGVVKEIAVGDASVALTIADNAAMLDKPIVTGHFAGTGGIEGPAEAEGRDKRRSYGYVFNVEGRILDKVNNIWEFNDPAFPLQSIVDVRDIGRSAAPAPTSVSWQGSIAATLTALQAATAVPGSGVIAPSIGCVKWWTQPAGPLTADLIGSGDYGNTAIALTKHIANELSVSMSTTPGSLTSAMANTANAGVHVGDDRMTAANAIDRLLLGAGVFWRFAPAGTLDLLPIDIANPVETLVGDSITRQRIMPPHRSRKMGYKRNERQMSDSEIASLILTGDIGDFGDYIVPLGANLLSDDLFTPGTWDYYSADATKPSQVDGAATASFKEAWRPLVTSIPLGGSVLRQVTIQKRVPVTVGRWYWHIVRVAKSSGTGAGGAVSLAASWLDSSESILSTFSTSVNIVDLPSGGAYQQMFMATQAPAGAAFLDFAVLVTSNTNSGSIRFDGPILTDIEPAADVTMAVGYGPAAATVKYDYLGTALTGELPVDFLYKVDTAAGTYGGAVTWKYKVLLGTVNGHASGATEYTDTIAGSSGTGTLTLNSLGANDNQVEIVAYINGRRRSTVLTLTKDIQAAPTSGGGGGGGSSSQSSGFSSFSGTTFVVVTNDILYTTPSGQTTVTLSSTLGAKPSSSPGNDGSWNIEFKFQRETSPGTWTDVGGSPLITGSSSAETDPDSGGFQTRTAANLTGSKQATSLTASTQYKFRGVARINATGSTNTTRTHALTGTVNAISP